MIRTRLLIALLIASASLVQVAGAQIRYVGGEVQLPETTQDTSDYSSQQSYQGQYDQLGSVPKTTEYHPHTSVTSSPKANDAIAMSGSFFGSPSADSASGGDRDSGSANEDEAPSGGRKSLGVYFLIGGAALASYWVFVTKQRIISKRDIKKDSADPRR